MSRLYVHGRSAPAPSEPEPSPVPDLTVRVKHEIEVEFSRAGAVPRPVDIAEDDVIEVALENGVRLWTRLELLQQDNEGATERAAGIDGFVLPPTMGIGAGTRGVGEWAIKGLRVLGVDLASDIGRFVAERVETRGVPDPGLYRCTADSPDARSTIDPAALRAGPVLLFIHGTASSTSGSFGGLWRGPSTPRITGLLDSYAGRVLAFDHRTLSKSPIENALEIAASADIPAGSTLHLVTHSRGGLVGELLCRSMREGRQAFDAEDFALFGGDERERDLAALRELAEVLAAKELTIERFVRVACPARGTTFCGQRLDRYLSLIVNAIGALPFLAASPVYDAFKALLLGIVKTRTNPRQLPGLEAQMPDSPLVRMLNRLDVRTRADLHVLGGDIEGAGLLDSIRVLATDLFFREDHDLVVNTPAMLGGAERTGGIRYWIDQGAGVNHFSYFVNDETADRLVAALVRPNEEERFHVLDRKPAEITPDDYRKRSVTPQPVVFVLPGIMGSHLEVNGERVWLDFLELAKGGMSRLRTTQPAKPDGLIGTSYGDLVRMLGATHEVVPFPYDWRHSLEESAALLRQAIESRLPEAERTNQPIRIIAHSMGGLVVRAMLASAQGQAVWERMGQHPGSRLVMLGTPNGGAHCIVAILLGRDPLVGKLALLDFRNSHAQLLEIIARFDGVLQLLPERSLLDFFDATIWQKLRDQDVPAGRGLFSSDVATSRWSGVPWPVPEAGALDQARRIREAMSRVRLDPKRVAYVAGSASATAVDVRIDPSAREGRRVRVLATEHGDGRVPWDTGIPEELEIAGRVFYMDAVHGDMAAHAEAFPALRDLLESGTTAKLRQTPPVRRSATDATFEMPYEPPAMFPDEEELVAAAVGGTRRRKRHKPARVRVEVVHGDLSQARSPVVVGHYDGDSIVSAEKFLDRALDGRLRELHRVGLYPGPIGTEAVFLDRRLDDMPDSDRLGAIVIGLGDVGELTPGKLTAAFVRGAVKFAAECLERERASQRPHDAKAGPMQIRMAALLIGTGAGGFSVADSLQAILRGVLRANNQLERLDADRDADRDEAEVDRKGPTVRIAGLDIIELYEDRAIQAVKALIDLARSEEFRQGFEFEETLNEQKSGRHRASFVEDPDWWQRLLIEESGDALKFTALTNRARAESFLQSGQRGLVEAFINGLQAQSATDTDSCYTLFELLLPNTLKEYAPDRRNLVLVLDEGAAAYPWELLHNRFEQDSRPISVDAGIVRQLRVRSNRERVHTTSEPTALVVGDPANDDPRFPALPGARAEARAVADMLKGVLGQADGRLASVTSLIGEKATPRSVLTALFAKPYRILHCAAHGVFEFDPSGPDGTSGPASAEKACGHTGSTVSGMALGGGLFLTAATIEQLRFIPDLVFLNCCHLGQARGEVAVRYHRLAANLATQCIRAGCRAVIAAGWAVNDAAASTFATTFYDEFLRGQTFGDAVRLARQAAYRAYPATNTWGAYQCYGDPGFSLDRDGRQTWSRREPRIVARAELRAEAERIAREASAANEKVREGLRGELDRLVSAMPASWRSSASVCAAIGAAWGELGALDRAIEWLDRTRRLDPADAGIRALEQLANFNARYAARVHATEPATARACFRQAKRALQLLLEIGETSERRSLVGSLAKRRARVYRHKARRAAIEAMSKEYHLAWRLASDPEGPSFGHQPEYPLQNWLTAEVVLGWKSSHIAPAVVAGFERWKELAESRKAGKAPDFWSLSMPIEITLLEHLAGLATQPDIVSTVAERFRRLRLRIGTPVDMQSVLDQIEFLKEMAGTEAAGPKSRKLQTELDSLRKALT